MWHGIDGHIEARVMNMTGERLFTTFYLDGHLFGVEVATVQEVIGYQEMTSVPLAPPIVRGLINLRGQIVTAVDLRRCLDMQERTPDRLPMNVVVRTGDETVSLLVDEIGDVLKLDVARFEEPPETLQGEAREFIRGVYKLDGKLLLVQIRREP